QVGLYEWNVPLGFDKAIGQLFGAHLAAFRQRFPARYGETLDAAFDRHAASLSEQLQHLWFPQVDPRLDAKFQSVSNETPQQFFVGEENFVNEINVFGTLVQ